MKALELFATCTLLGLPLLVACAHEDQSTPASQSSYGQMNVQPVSVNAAIDRITTSRCDFEQTCNNVGPNQTYPDRSSCLTKTRGDLSTDLRADQCPAGIDGRGLDKCVAEIRGERCGNVLDTVGRLTACRTSELCLR